MQISFQSDHRLIFNRISKSSDSAESNASAGHPVSIRTQRRLLCRTWRTGRVHFYHSATNHVRSINNFRALGVCRDAIGWPHSRRPKHHHQRRPLATDMICLDTEPPVRFPPRRPRAFSSFSVRLFSGTHTT